MMKKGDGIPTDMEKDKKQQKKTSPELVKEASSQRPPVVKISPIKETYELDMRYEGI
jgi:hypothetical protein